MPENNSEYFDVYGTAVITIRFENRIQWQKYRKYILKTNWDFDGGSAPYVAELPIQFACIDDIEQILKKVVNLLQLGFDVYSCHWKLKRKEPTDDINIAEETTPIMTR